MKISLFLSMLPIFLPSVFSTNLAIRILWNDVIADHCDAVEQDEITKVVKDAMDNAGDAAAATAPPGFVHPV
jgi:hypothetical protein